MLYEELHSIMTEIMRNQEIDNNTFIELRDVNNGEVDTVVRVRDIAAIGYSVMSNKCVVYLTSGTQLYVQGTPAGIKEMIYDALDG